MGQNPSGWGKGVKKGKNGPKSPKFGPKMGSEWDGILQDWGKGVKKGKKLTEITQI